MAANGLHISISAETLFHVGPLPVTNSMITSLIASALLIGFALIVRSGYSQNKTPTGIQNFAEWMIEALYNLIEGITGSSKKAIRFFPFIATFFFFIVLNNWIGLLPGVGTIGIVEKEHTQNSQQAQSSLIPQAYAATSKTENSIGESDQKTETIIPIFRAGTADLNMTLALAVISQVLAQFFGFQYVGFGYLKKFFNFSSPIAFFVGIIEFVGEFTRVISFAFRLFGNIFAGEVLLVVIAFLSKGIIVPIPFYAIEIFVGLIQGLVFMMLSVVFFNMATISHDDH